MEVRFADKDLERLEADFRFTAGLSPAIVKAFRKRMQLIRDAPDERAFYAMKSLHYERLSGNRRHQHSMRLNRQYRLILEYELSSDGKVVVIVSIEDYH